MQRFLVAGFMVSALASSAAATPERDACLAKGTKQASAHAYQDALATFEECLKLAPADEVILSERAAAAIAAKLPADGLAREAVAAAKTPAVRAASLFSLALTEHDWPDLHVEVEALKASLRLRPNAQVQARLAKMKPGATVEPSFAAAAMAGPYASIEAACQAATPEARRLVDTYMRHRPGELACTCKAGKPIAAGPFDEARLVDVQCAAKEGVGRVEHLAVKTQAGWFAARVLEAYPENERACSVEELQVRAAAVGALVVVRGSAIDRCTAYSLVRDLAFEDVSVAGLGPSGRPSLVGPIETGNHHVLHDPSGEDESPPFAIADWHLDAAVTPAGELELTGSLRDFRPELVRAVVGKHALGFL